jgi:integrase
LESAKITLNEHLDRWLETAVRPRVREKTYQDYQGILRRYVRPNLGERVLAGIRPLDLQTMYYQMSERNLSARTVRYTHVVLKSAMQQALQWHLLLENPATGVKVPQQPRNEMRALTIDQARTLLKFALTTRYGPVLAVALTTGMRPSEYLGLKWQDIDWIRQTACIVRSIRKLNGEWLFSDTKRARSRRPIRLQGWIVALLRDVHQRTLAGSSCPEAADLVFKTASGQPINADSLAKHFKSILELCGLPPMRLYDLRPLGSHNRAGSRSVAQGRIGATRPRQHSVYIGHLRSRASAHAGGGGGTGRGRAYWRCDEELRRTLGTRHENQRGLI